MWASQKVCGIYAILTYFDLYGPILTFVPFCIDFLLSECHLHSEHLLPVIFPQARRQ